MKLNHINKKQHKNSKGIVLAEAIIGIGISAMIVGTLLAGYITTSKRIHWTINTTVAQAIALGEMEETFGAKWNNSIDEMTNSCTKQQSNVFIRTQVSTFLNNSKATNTVTITAH